MVSASAVALFGSGRVNAVKEWWDVAAAPNDPEYLTALSCMAQSADQLPGAVFFTVPPSAQGDNGWELLAERSRRLCACGQRRLIMPTSPRQHIIGVGEPIVLAESEFLELGPWGGDTLSAYMRFRIGAGELRVLMWPYLAKPWSIDQTPLVVQADGSPRDDRVVESLEFLANTVASNGENIFMARLVNGVTVPVCSVVAADPGAGTATIRVDASIVVGSLDTSQQHKCRQP